MRICVLGFLGVVLAIAGCTDSATMRDGAVDRSGDGAVDATPADDARAADVGGCDDGHPCTVDRWDGASCAHAPGNAGAICRPRTGYCDLAETCSGTDVECPVDAARPVRLYGASGGSLASSIYVLDPESGSTIAALSDLAYAIAGLAVHPDSGVLYGVTTRGSPASPLSLVTIDPLTGSGRALGPLGFFVADIAFDRAGVLYGWAEQSAMGSPVDDLVTIDLATGAAAVVAESGLETRGSGLAFGPDDRLYFTGAGSNGHLVLVDPALGIARSTVGSLGGHGVPITALAFDVAGRLFAVEVDAPGATLLRIDPATADTVILERTDVTDLDAIVFACD